jgi:hypothetical protein
MSNSNISEELSKLLNELDDESLSKMNDSDIIELRKKLNPYGRTIEGSDNILTYSYTDLRHNYLKNMIMTSMIGFLNRMCDEWKVPDGIPVIPVYEYLQNPEKLNDFEKTLQKPELMRSDLDENKECMGKRVIIKEFLEDMFQYNPDFHVRSSYKPNVKDPERNIINSPAGQLAIYQLKKFDPDFNNKWISYEREQKINKKIEPTNEIISQVKKYCTEMIPPVDIFHKFNYYYESNYEEIKSIVNDLYCEKYELETALNPYSWHATEDDADKFIDKHKNEVISTIYKAHSGKWNIFAPYKHVRESMRFFNDKTHVLEEIAKQIERDSKLGAELMKKRIKIKKNRNIKTDGPDDPGFLKWKEQNDIIKQVNNFDTSNEKDYAPDDCPDDAITVPVYRMSSGGTKVDKSFFYTQAEKPTYVNGKKID